MDIPETIAKKSGDPAFADRLIRLCDNHPHVPPQYGRLSWVRRNLQSRFGVTVSTETVRKWFAGQTKPRADKIRLLALLLQADEAYLSLGRTPEKGPGESRKQSGALAGSVYLVAGLLEMSGFSIAFPSEDDPRRDDVDIYAIVAGKQRSIKVAMARDLGDWKYQVTAKPSFASVTNVVVIRTSTIRFDLIVVPAELVTRFGDPKGDRIEIPLHREDDSYSVGDTNVPKLRALSNI